MFRWWFFLACLALYSQVAISHRLSNIRAAVADSFESESIASAHQNSEYIPNYTSSVVTRVPLKANYHVDLNPKHIEREGIKLMTIDAPETGCPMMDFSAQVTIGGQGPFECIIDTGSTALGIAATTCGTTCPVPAEYNPSGATTLVQGATFSSTFGDGSMWTGAAVSDTVAVGSSTATTIQFAAINNQNNFFRPTNCQGTGNISPNSGIIGFAFAGLGIQGQVNGAAASGVKADSWFAKNVAATGNPAVFALRHCELTGDLFLNGYDTNSFTDQIHWTNVATFDYIYGGHTYPLNPGNDFWTVDVLSIGVAGGAADSNAQDFNGNGQTFGVNSIVDSGTTVALLPPTAFTDLVNGIPATQFKSWFGSTPASFFASYQCASSTVNAATMNAALSKSVITIGNSASGTPVSITLNGINFLLQQVTTNGATVYCSGVQNNGDTFAANSNGDVILGWSFINQLIVVHDTKNNRIGFAPRNGGCADGSSGAVGVSGGDTGIVDPTGGTGQSTATTSSTTTTTAPTKTATTTKTTTKATATTTAAVSTNAATTTTTTATFGTTPVVVPSAPCLVWGCPSTNTNCAAGTTGPPTATTPAGCFVQYEKVALKLNLNSGAVSVAGQTTAAATLLSALVTFLQMNNHVAINLDPNNGVSLKGNTLTLLLDLTCASCSLATTQAAAQSIMDVSSSAFDGTGMTVTSVSGCTSDQLDANGDCVTSTSTDSGSSSSSSTMIIIISAGAGAAVLLIAIGIFLYRRRANKAAFANNAANMRPQIQSSSPSTSPYSGPYTAQNTPPHYSQQPPMAWQNRA